MYMLIAALFILAKRWKQSKCPQMNELICVVYTYNEMSFKKEVLTHATTLMNLDTLRKVK